MATIVLGTVGTLVGGPIGGAIGALVGRQIDGAIFGETSEGPRLKELAVTTSSYGAHIPRVYGKMRMPGTIIWATDLIETSEKSGGGKGKPSTKTYSYSISMAIALSSRAIIDVGRIWADGNLLRGASGALKVGGDMRLYRGHPGQGLDPLISADQGAECPAFRDCAYIVFENLELAEFGNRVPTLTFEVIGDTQPLGISSLLDGIVGDTNADVPLTGLDGFAMERGSLADNLSLLGRFFPIAVDASSSKLRIISTSQPSAAPPLLPPVSQTSSVADGKDRVAITPVHKRLSADTKPIDGIRYYDSARDYQAGVQRCARPRASGQAALIELPATLGAEAARSLATTLAERDRWRRTSVRWRVSELDPAIGPGVVAQIEGDSNRWLVENWEWSEEGVELALLQLPPAQPVVAPAQPADPGYFPVLPDEDWAPTRLRGFELPWDGVSVEGQRQIFAAASGAGAIWAGAQLYLEGPEGLSALGASGRQSAVQGALNAALPGSDATRFESAQSLIVTPFDSAMQFTSTTMEGLAMGANNVLVGPEIIQFLEADQLPDGVWRLHGLLRGRGASEDVAASGHHPGTLVTLLDDRLSALPADDAILYEGSNIAALGKGETQPVSAPLENRGLSLKPLTPVHGRAQWQSDGTLSLSWCRRARGAWVWHDAIETPLVEESERYLVGIGAVDAPTLRWETAEPRLMVTAGFLAPHAGQPVWVRQVGRHALSKPLLLTVLIG